jgi:hypothetical protein
MTRHFKNILHNTFNTEGTITPTTLGEHFRRNIRGAVQTYSSSASAAAVITLRPTVPTEGTITPTTLGEHFRRNIRGAVQTY